jgi:hypothetical protein
MVVYVSYLILWKSVNQFEDWNSASFDSMPVRKRKHEHIEHGDLVIELFAL